MGLAITTKINCMEKINIIDGPSIDDLEATINFDDRSRYEDFQTEKGCYTIFMKIISIIPQQLLDIKIENCECKIEYSSKRKTGTLTFF